MSVKREYTPKAIPAETNLDVIEMLPPIFKLGYSFSLLTSSIRQHGETLAAGGVLLLVHLELLQGMVGLIDSVVLYWRVFFVLPAA